MAISFKIVLPELLPVKNKVSNEKIKGIKRGKKYEETHNSARQSLCMIFPRNRSGRNEMGKNARSFHDDASFGAVFICTHTHTPTPSVITSGKAAV